MQLLLENLIYVLSFTGTAKVRKMLRSSIISFLTSVVSSFGTDVEDALKIFCQHVIIRCPDKADSKQDCIDFLIKLREVNPQNSDKLFLFFGKLSRNKKIAMRTFALDLAFNFLQTISQEGADQIDNMALLLDTLVSRTNDKSAKIRAKTLQHLVILLSSPTVILKDCLSKCFISDTPLSRPLEKFLSLLHKRCSDESPTVRKSSLQALSSLLLLEEYQIPCVSSDLQVLMELSGDPSIAIQKQVMLSITNLLDNYPQVADVFFSWCNIVLPLSLVQEATVQQKALDYILQVFIPSYKNKKEFQKCLQEKITRLENLSRNLESMVSRALSIAACKELVSSTFVDSVNNLVSSSISRGVLIIFLGLAESPLSTQLNWRSLLECWTNCSLQEEDEELVLKCLGFLSEHIPTEEANALLSSLEAKLITLDCSFGNLFALSETIFKLVPDDQRIAVANNVLASLSDQIEKLVYESDSKATSLSEKCIFSVGSIVLSSGVVPPDSTLLFLSTLITSTAESFSLQIKAHSLLTLGKCCIVSEAHAKKFITLLINQLRSSDSSSLRNNVVIILGDICRVHTSVVDQHVSSLSLPLIDPDPLVRKHTLMTLIRLLQEEFIKFKGALVLKIISKMIDDNEDVSRLAQSCIEEILISKSPGYVCTSLIDAIFFLNACCDHPSFNQFPSKEADASFSLTGQCLKPKRFEIYERLCNLLSDEQKISVSSRINEEVFGAIIDNSLKLSKQAEGAISDCLQLLTNKSLKVSRTNNNAANEVDFDDLEESKRAIQEAKAIVLAEMHKKNSLQNILPTILSLKRVLENQRCCCIRDVMDYLRVLIEEYGQEKEQLEGISSQLMKEIAYDLDRYKKEQIEKEKRKEILKTPKIAAVDQTPARSNVRLPTPMSGRFSTPRLKPQVLNKYAHSADSIRRSTSSTSSKKRQSADFSNIITNLQFEQNNNNQECLSGKKRKLSELEGEDGNVFQLPWSVKKQKRHSI
jgi:hypothetical protein